MPITITTAKTQDDLKSILLLQSMNHRSVVNNKEKISEGFVSIRHDLALLEKMNTPYPHVIAVDNDEVVGYTLIMQKSFRNEIPLLFSMFEMIDDLEYNGIPLRDGPYFIMGQACVAKTHRRKGVFRKLYEKLIAETKDHFRFIITEVSKSNMRSMDAHKVIGFQTLHIYEDSTDQWELLIFDLGLL